MNPSDTTAGGATVVVTHQVRGGSEADYERWLGEIGPAVRSSPGNLDWHLVRPVPGLTTTFAVIVRFDTPEHLGAWMASADRRRLIERVRPLLAGGDDYTIRTGLDFWFTGGTGAAKVPVRWKQFLVAWSAIYPLVLGTPVLLSPLLRATGVPDNRYVVALAVTGTVVFLMTYVVMPRYTKLVRRWLFA